MPDLESAEVERRRRVHSGPNPRRRPPGFFGEASPARRQLGLCLLVLGALGAGAREPADPETPIVVRNADGATTRVLREAVRAASRWLADDGCREIFSDFRDARGRALVEVLRAVGREGHEYLRWLIFFNGAHEKGCLEGGAFATTMPGSRVVYLCPGFKNLHSDRTLAAAIVIHEELHSLGLGEDPPSSLEITNRVLSRCVPP